MPEAVTILLADGDDASRQELTALLTQGGYKVFTASDGPMAVEFAREERPNLIILDARLSGMSGFETCQALREDATTSETPILLMTDASSTVETEIEGLRAGATDYLHKPVSQEALMHSVQSALPEAVLSQTAKVLIVDDSKVNLQVMEGYLYDTGYRIDLASNGPDAIVMAQQDPPDIVLLDVQMPGMDGFEVCKALKSDPRTNDIPIMFVTANALSDEEMLKGFEIGAVDYLRKPFLRDELLARLTVMVRIKQQQTSLQRQVYTDPLTGLPNRRLLFNRLAEEFARSRRHTKNLTVLLLDIDHFKDVNDTYGHDAGDVVLKHIGELIGDLVRKEDVVARFGGEEFAFVLPETALEQALILAQRVRRSIAELAINYGGQQIPITVSIGAACFPTISVENPRELLRYADEALYRAKHGGRNQVQAFHPTADA